MVMRALLPQVAATQNFADCVSLARNKFAKYFSHKALTLAKNFPKDATTSAGEKFWAYPKLFPSEVVFKAQDALHRGFVKELAIAYAGMMGIKVIHSLWPTVWL